MSLKTDDRLSPGQRLTRGLKYTAVGPVDVTRGTVGLSWQGAQSAATSLRQRVEKSRLAKELVAELEDAQETIAHELAEAREVLANLPQALADARKPKRRPRPLVLAAAGVAMIAVGGVVFSIVRRSMQPDPSPRPPSVEPPQRP
jgi:cell wall synthesis protein CwsA